MKKLIARLATTTSPIWVVPFLISGIFWIAVNDMEKLLFGKANEK